ncbi:MAG: DUF5906 domain-containing protein, partial [Promethearchaeota archaeon]
MTDIKKNLIPEDFKIEMKKKIKEVGKPKEKRIKKCMTRDLIIEKVKIPDLINLDSDNHCICPFKGNTPPNRSFVYYPYSETWCCFHPDCKGGDVIHLFQQLNNIFTYNEALYEMAKQYNISFGKVDKKYIERETEIHELFQDFMEKCHSNPEFQNKYKLIEMKKRGFTEETIERFKIGLFDDSIKEYLTSKYSEKLLYDAGFKDFSVKDKAKRGKLYWKWGKRIVYPYFDQNDNPRYFIYRVIDLEPDFAKNNKYMKQMKTEYVQEIPFGLNSINLLRKRPLIITEGMTDAISVIQANYPCLSPITVRIKKEDIEKMINYCKRFDKVIVINDNEKNQSGLEGAIDTLKGLLKNGINCYIGLIPNPEYLDKIDLDDYLKPDLDNTDNKDINKIISNSLEDQTIKIDNLIKDSEEGLDFLIKQIDPNHYTDSEIMDLLELIPEGNFSFLTQAYQKIKTHTKIPIKYIEEIHDKLRKSKIRIKKAKNVKIGTSLEELKNEILSWDDKLNDNEIIYKIFKEIKNEPKNNIDNLILVMAKRLKYYNVNKLKRIKIACEFDDIVDKLHIDLDLETITDEEIKRITLEINARRTVILDSLFMWFNFNLGIGEERVRDALLPYIKETTDFIIKNYPCFILIKTNDIYLFENGVYIKQHKTPNDFLEEIILKEIPYNIKEIAGELKINRRIKIIAKEIIAQIQITEDDLNFDILNFKNGVLFLEDIKNKTWFLKPHNPKYRSIIQFTIPFYPFVKPSKEIKPFFIKQLGIEQVSRLMQLYGIALTGTPYKWKAITFLDGKSGTGKSEVILKTLETIISQAYISYEPFLNLISDEDDFASGSLLGSLINIHGEIEDKALMHPEGINKLTEEFINVNKKYGFKGKIKNHCSHFYAMNVVPQIPNEERIDVFRRIEYLKIVGDPIPEDKRDPDYFKKIIEKSPNELIAILNEILMGLSEVLNNGTINSCSILEKREIYRQASLPLWSFIKKWCIRFETDKETKPSETYLIERHYFLKIYNKYREELNLEKIENLWALTNEENKLPYDYKMYRIQKG